MSRYDDTHDKNGRDEFRLHKPGRTIGCIAATDEDNWEKIRDIIRGTEPTGKVPDNKGYGWWKLGDASPIIKFGTIHVK